MENNNDILSEIKELSPSLAKLQKKNPFSIPENYFEILTQKIRDVIFLRDGISEPSWNLDWLINFLLKPQYSLSLAIMVIAIIFGAQYFVPKNNLDQQLDKISADKMNEYVKSNLDDYDESTLGIYCCVNFNNNDFIFKNQKEQDDYIDKYLMENLKTEDILYPPPIIFYEN